jgi:hypothetical protein
MANRKVATIEVSEEEAQILINLLDISVKAGGLPWAASASTWAMKIQNANYELKEKSS